MLVNNVFWLIVTVVSLIVEWTVLKIVLDEISSIKRKKAIVYLNLLISISIILVLSINNFNPNIKLFIGIAITFIFYISNYEVSKLKGFLISLLYWMILIGFDAIGVSLVTLINSLENINKLLENNILRLELIILTKLLLISLIPLIKFRKIKLQINKRECIYITIPLLANIISITSIFGFIFKDRSVDANESITILIISIILLLSNISLVVIISRIIKDNKLRLENKIIKEKMDIQYQYYLNLKESQSKTRKLYHDMNNHMICIKNICGLDERADKYIDEITSQLRDCNILFDTGNVILDVILNEKKSICNKYDIEFLVDVKFSECDFIDMADVCSIFSNMIDNAIEACKKINSTNISKVIKLRGTIVNQFAVIKCKNTKINDIIIKKDKIITDKRDYFIHGIGISSIKNSVEKYDGNVEIDISDNDFLMTIYIPLI